METFLKLFFDDNGTKNEMKIDNSTEFKDCTIKQLREDNGEVQKQIHFQIDSEKQSLEINGIELSPTALHVLKQFLNQI